ncbi:CDP-alcohol phosphatidyltransferase family protein [Nevskia sp.]|uniref:CDP-alcohol phosphatidyltransferase family protein n=1 Tax=Nevskia sp. TaxID=1929292 RepID=UPI0025DAACE3|nr:CDP-alcohol phosphatidyltransferase family protein [Nevskia sp.]
MNSAATSSSPAPALPACGVITGRNSTLLWGMSSSERLNRCLKRAGVPEVRTADRLGDLVGGTVLVLSNDWVFDVSIVIGLAKRPGTLVIDPLSRRPVAAHVDAGLVLATIALLNDGSGTLPGHIERLGPEEVSGTYNHELRKKESPYLLELTPETRAAVERRMFNGSYKGVTDFVTKFWWPRPAEVVTRWCSHLGLSPNMVTTIGAIGVVYSFWAFWHGHYISGLASGWIMTFLDTVDGKLARVTLTSSKWGNVFDHGIDLVHPPFWWWAWIVGLAAYGTPSEYATLALWIIVAGYVVQRILEGIFEWLFGMHVHVWRPFDSFFRLITARRNPNLVILTPLALLGRPDVGILLVALWTALSLLVHAVQIVQGLAARRRAPITSWLAA